MARTKASVGAKVAPVKSSKARAAAPPPPPSPSPRSGGSGGTSRNSLAGGNHACPRPTPDWQLPITRFFRTDAVPQHAMDVDDDAGPSRPEPAQRRRRNAIESDEETEFPPAAAAPAELDGSVVEELPPLDGDSCHKIAEYFPKQGRSDPEEKDKENIRRNSNKRDLEDGEVSISKKVKVSV